MNNRNDIETLPIDVLFRILLLLDAKSIALVSRVSKQMYLYLNGRNRISENQSWNPLFYDFNAINSFWKNKFEEKYSYLIEFLPSQDNIHYEKEFKKVYSIECLLQKSQGQREITLFYCMQEGSLSGLMKLNLQFSDFYIKNKKNNLLIDFIYKGQLHRQELYDYLYQIVLTRYTKHNSDAVDVLMVDEGKMTLLHWCCFLNQDKQTAEILIQEGSHIDATNQSNKTPIFLATENNNIELVNLLIKNNANISLEIKNINNYENQIPLSVALSSNYIDLAKIFIDKIPDLNQLLTTGRTPLGETMHYRKLEAIQYLIKKGVNVNLTVNRNKSPLHFIDCSRSNPKIQEMEIAILKILIENGADVNEADKCTLTKLHEAVYLGRFDIVKLLIENGAAIDPVNDKNQTPLHLASRGYDLDMFKYLIDQKANVNSVDNKGETPLWVASDNGLFEYVKYLVEHGANINLANNDGVSPIWVASQWGYLNIVEYLIDRKSDINLCNNLGQSPLFAALGYLNLNNLENNNIETIAYLIKKGADLQISKQISSVINYTADNGMTRLLFAAYKGNLDVFKFLVENGADVNQGGCKNGETPLIIAAQQGHLQVVQYLIEEKNVDVNFSDRSGATPLLEACCLNQLDVVKFLIQKGANINYSSEQTGTSALHLAIYDGYLELTKYLIEQGAEINHLNQKNQCTPLLLAVAKNNIAIVKLLIEKGAEVNQFNIYDTTPISLAIDNNHVEIAEYLYETIEKQTEVSNTPPASQFPNEIWLRILCQLDIRSIGILSLVEKSLFKLANAFFKRKFQVHFPHKLDYVKMKTYPYWYSEFIKADRKDFVNTINRRFEDFIVNLFYLVKEKNLEALKILEETIQLHHLIKEDASGNSILDWAFQNKDQATLDFFYQLVMKERQRIKSSNINEILIHEISILGFAILCHQSKETLQLLIQQGANPNEAGDRFNRTPLILAARCGHLDAVKYLVEEHNANIHHVVQANDGMSKDLSATVTGSTPILVASRRGHLEIVKYFDSHNAKSEETKKENLICFIEAISHGQLDIVKYFFEKNQFNLKYIDNQNQSILWSAVENGHINTIHYLLEKGVDIHRKSFHGKTIMFAASFGGHVEVMKYLAKSGLEINPVDQAKNSVFLLAVGSNDFSVVEYLLKNGIDPNQEIEDIEKQSALMLACSRKYVPFATIKCLIQHGANVNYKNNENETPLFVAAKENRTAIVKYLIEHGADVNLATKKSESTKRWEKETNNKKPDGITPLMLGVKNNNLEIVKFLVQNNARIDQSDNQGHTPIIIALQQGYIEIAKYLIEKIDTINKEDEETILNLVLRHGDLELIQILVNKGLNIHEKDKYRPTPLMIASEHGHLDIVKFLIAQGVDINQRYDGENTAIKLAAEKNHIELVKYLFIHGAQIDGLNPLEFKQETRIFLNLLKSLSTKDNDLLKQVLEEKMFTKEFTTQNTKTINFLMLIILWCRYYLLEGEKSEKTEVIKHLINLILNNLDTPFKKQVSDLDEIYIQKISQHHNSASHIISELGSGISSFFGFFSQEFEKSAREKIVLESNNLAFIKMLTVYADRYTRQNQNLFFTTAGPIPLQNSNADTPSYGSI